MFWRRQLVATHCNSTRVTDEEWKETGSRRGSNSGAAAQDAARRVPRRRPESDQQATGGNSQATVT